MALGIGTVPLALGWHTDGTGTPSPLLGTGPSLDPVELRVI